MLPVPVSFRGDTDAPPLLPRGESKGRRSRKTGRRPLCMTQAVYWWKWMGIITIGVVLTTVQPIQADHHEQKGSPSAALQTIIAGSHRSEADKARDQYRHPAETLSFFGIKDDMTVVEIWPGGGWYTDILAPFLKERGTYYAAGIDPESASEVGRATVQKYKEKLAANPDLFG